MKLSHKDKVLLLTFSIILLLAVGIFVIIRPLRDDIKKNEAKRNTAQSEKNKIDDKITQIPDLGKKILKSYEAAKEIADQFSASQEDYQMDKYLQEKLNASNVFVSGELKLSEAEAANITYYCYTPSVLNYSLKTYADINGNYDIRDRKILAKSNYFSQKTPETIAVSRMVFNFYCGKTEYLHKFIDDMADETGRILISALSIDDREKIVQSLKDNKITITKELYFDAQTGTVSIDSYAVEVIDKPENVKAS